MAEVDIDQLRIQIEADAASARNGIKGLAADVRSLRSAVSGSTASNLNNIASALAGFRVNPNSVSGMSAVANAAKKLDGLRISSTIAKNVSAIGDACAKLGNASQASAVASALRTFDGIKISSSIGNQLKKVSEGVAQLNATKVDSSKFTALAGSLRELTSVEKGNLNSLIRSLGKLPAAIAGLQSVDLTGFARQCQQISAALGNLPDKLGKVSAGFRSLAAASRGGSGMSLALRQASNESGNLIQRLLRIGGTVGSLAAIRQGFQAVKSAVTSCVDAANRYVEDMNLFNVALGDYATAAEGYANRVSQRLGINIQDWLRAQGTFTTMAKGMGVATGAANTMGQTLTQLSYDLASLYNISDDTAFEKVRAGLAGELEPLRALGFDLSVARLQQEAYNLGLSQSVSSMDQSQKAMLRYYAIMHQVTWAHGDMARSIESPANLMRVFAGAVNQAAVSIGTIFLPMIRAIVPVAIAAARVVATLANMIADLTGGSQIAAVNYAAGGVADSMEGAATAADDADKAIGGAGNAAKGTGSKAAKAAKQVKELKRQLMGFDEINMFSKQADSGSGSGGSGGGGGGGTGGGGGGNGGKGGSIPIQTYDFFGNAKNISDDLYNQMMALVKRLGKAFAPLVDAIKPVIAAIRSQFEGLDLAGAAANALAGFANLVSNFVRQIVEILGPLVVAFNFPETLAVALDGAAQVFLTLSGVINGVGTVIKNFSDRALIPLVAWIGDKVRGAILLCIDVLRSWQTWFAANIEGLAQLGAAAGNGARLVLTLAMAVSDGAFAVASVAFRALNAAIQGVLTVLVNSGAARSAATVLGAVLTALAVGNGIAMGLQAISNGFVALTAVISGGAASSAGKITLLSTSLRTNLVSAFGDARAGAQLLMEALGARMKAAANLCWSGMQRVTVAVRGAMTGIKNFAGGLVNAATRHANYDRAIVNTNLKLIQAKGAANEAGEAFRNESEILAEMRAAFESGTGGVKRLDLAQQSLTTKSAGFAAAAADSKVRMLEAKAASQVYAQQNGILSTGFVQLKGQQVAATAATAANGVASKACAVGAGALSVAQGVLNAVTAAFPGMALATILLILVQNFDGISSAVSNFITWLRQTFSPFDRFCLFAEAAYKAINDFTGGGLGKVVGAVGSAVGSMLGLSDSTAKVSDTTKDATSNLDQEAQQVQSNVKSIQEYAQKHDNLSDALAVAAQDTDRFSKYLQTTGQTFDDVKSKQDQFTQATVNSFNTIDTSQSMHFDTMAKNLQANITAQQQWSENMKTLMQRTGLDSNNALIQGLLQAGPEKMANAVQEAISDPTGQKLDQLKQLAQQTGNQLDPEVALGLSSTGGAATSAAGTDLMNKAKEGIDQGKDAPKNAAKDAGSQSSKAFGEGAKDARSEGGKTTKGYGEGVKGGSGEATGKAKKVRQDTVKALNGGSGYNEAKSAGRNLVGGFGDGIRQAMNDAVSKAKNVRTQVVRALNGGAGYNEARSAGRNLCGGYKDGIGDAAGAAASKARSVRSDVVRGLNGGAGYNEAKSAGRNLTGGFGDGIRQGSGGATSAARSVASSAASAMRSGGGTGRSAGRDLGSGFTSGLRSGASGARGAARSAAANAAGGFGGHYWSAYNAGINLSRGLGNGIWANRWAAWNSANAVARGAADRIRAALKVHSPSKVTTEIGGYFTLGLARGIRQQVASVNSSVDTVVSDALDATKAAGEMGRAAGRSFGAGVSAGMPSDLTAPMLYAEQAARRKADYGLPAPTAKQIPHEAATISADDVQLKQVIASAVSLGMMNVQTVTSSPSPQGGGDVSVVLRVDSEDLAKAVMRGSDRLARREGGSAVQFG